MTEHPNAGRPDFRPDSLREREIEEGLAVGFEPVNFGSNGWPKGYVRVTPAGTLHIWRACTGLDPVISWRSAIVPRATLRFTGHEWSATMAEAAEKAKALEAKWSTEAAQ